jgi:hypothetical protein
VIVFGYKGDQVCPEGHYSNYDQGFASTTQHVIYSSPLLEVWMMGLSGGRC